MSTSLTLLKKYYLILTSSKGGASPTGKLTVFKLMISYKDDMLVYGPYFVPLMSLNFTDLIK